MSSCDLPYNIYLQSNIKPVDESNFATQLFAKSPGQVTVKLTVRPQRNSRSQILKQAELTDELQIQVFTTVFTQNIISRTVIKIKY